MGGGGIRNGGADRITCCEPPGSGHTARRRRPPHRRWTRRHRRRRCDLGGAAGLRDELAFAQLYQRTSTAVYAAIVRVLRDHAQAAEVTQDVYLQLWEGHARFHAEIGEAIPWLLMIAHRRAVDRVRSSAARSRRELGYVSTDSRAAFDPVGDDAIARSDVQRLHRALNELPDAHRVTIGLAYLGGYSYTQVAELLGVPLGTVKSRVRDGMHKLRAALADGS
jgi:RNA polymerase sigma-70 factor (ECF subfamily)